MMRRTREPVISNASVLEGCLAFDGWIDRNIGNS
jgi:hypothetical protein